MFNFNVLMAMLIVITFFAPLFLGRSYRKAAKSREEFRQEFLKKMANRQFVLYALGVVIYVAGLLAVLPWPIIALGIHAPSIFRFEDHDNQTFVVIYSRFVLDNTGFIIYLFLSPVFIAASVIGMNRFEKSKRLMDAVEQSMKERR
jgi:H+/gluconate symporter-like permease